MSKSYYLIVYIFLHLVVFSSIFLLAGFGLVYVVSISFYPPAFDHVYSYSPNLPEYNDQQLRFSKQQIDQINAEFSDNIEKGWCLKIENGKVKKVNLSNESLANSTHVSFKCTGDFNAKLHSHPGALSPPMLSPADKDSLITGSVVSGRKTDCIVSTKLDKKDNPVMMNCFRPEKDRRFTRFEIIVS